MPIFVEVVQTTVVSNNAMEKPVISVGPAQYFYNADNKVLYLHPSRVLESTTEPLVGEMAILKTSDQTYEKREIVQFSSTQPGLVYIASLDGETGIVSLTFGDEPLNLSPGESRTFKQDYEVMKKTLICFTLLINEKSKRGRLSSLPLSIYASRNGYCTPNRYPELRIWSAWLVTIDTFTCPELALVADTMSVPDCVTGSTTSVLI